MPPFADLDLLHDTRTRTLPVSMGALQRLDMPWDLPLYKHVLKDYALKIREIGRAQELYEVQFQGRGWTNNAQRASSGSSKPRDPNAMNVDAARKGCFNCGGDHFVRDCKSPKNPCSVCKWLGGKHKNDCSQSKGKGRQVRASTSEPAQAPPQQSQVDFRTMDYEEAKAYFFDMHTAQMKAAGKGFAP
ncbi:hypothetical protein BU15DRAFT_71120 [Melanogaster broomeanus]|nr:hypothetical protein BU15DRAFT_71120 [Melanogaster broomeanus]